MKTIICMLLFTTFLITQIYSQTETFIKTSTVKKTDVMSEAVVIANKITSLPAKTDIIITEYAGGWWKIKKDNIVGYVSESDLNNNEEMKVLISKWNTGHSHPVYKDVFEMYIGRYGQPDSKSAYNDGDYHSQTYVWHCAAGKYRSVDFEENEYGVWKMKSEYESDCIR